VELFRDPANPGSLGTTIDTPRAIDEQTDCPSTVQGE
jgi:hypothetical protein